MSEDRNITPFPAIEELQLPESGKTGWRSPSNIALIKYWGKKDIQLPCNPSISFTLKNAVTETYLSFEKKQGLNSISLEFMFEGKRNETFEAKVVKFLELVAPYFSFLKNFHFRIETSNSFPHSSGIASSASGMSALALCLCSIERDYYIDHYPYSFEQKASFISRLGSGSACRSIYGGLAVWGKHKAITESNDNWAIAYPGKTSAVFNTFQDTILLVDKGRKTVSSTIGHSLMNGHPFAGQRFVTADQNLALLCEHIESGNLKEFGNIVEKEALMLHAMMMTSDPYFLLMKPNTLNIIEKTWEFRNKTGANMYITLDAGANVHLLYPENEKNTVLDFVESKLIGYCENKQYICDSVGGGPEQL